MSKNYRNKYKNLEIEIQEDRDNDPNSNIILDDYLNLIRCSYPHCNCGKCISKKLSHNSPNYKYAKNINSSYRKEYLWKEKQNTNTVKAVNRNLKQNTLKNNHLKDSLISTMKKDFNKILENNNKNFENTKETENDYNINNLNNNNNEENFNTLNTELTNTNINTMNLNYNSPFDKPRKHLSEYQSNLRHSLQGNNINNCNDKENRPFIGRSNYYSMFPNWQLAKNLNNFDEKKPRENIPLHGSSDYKEKYIRHEKNIYTDNLRKSPQYNIDRLANKGEFIKESTFKDDFKPINTESFKDVNDKVVSLKQKNWIISGPYSKNSFLSSYEKAFMYNNLSGKKDKALSDNNNKINVIC